MTTTQAAPARSKPRQRGSIRPHRSGFQIRVTAGVDSATGERIVLCETAATEREAEKVRTRLLAQADALTTARSKANFGYLLDAWFPKHEVGPSAKITALVLSWR